MGNQQERSLAWLAGVLEAEGSISFQVYTLPDGRIRITPYICLVNTDVAILTEARRIMDGLLVGDKGAKTRNCGHGGTNRPCHVIRLDGVACGIVAAVLLPYMIGEKRANVEAVLKYIEGRKSGLILRDGKGRIKRAGYTRAEIELISSIRSHKRAKSSEAICQAPNVVG